jgi:hypothetical protein
MRAGRTDCRAYRLFSHLPLIETPGRAVAPEMEPQGYLVRIASRYGCPLVALAALSCGQASSPGGAGSAGASGGSNAEGGASTKGGAGGKSGAGGKGGAANTLAGAGGTTTEGGAAGEAGGEAGAETAGTSTTGGASSSGAGGAGVAGAQGGAPPVPDNDLCSKATVIALGATSTVDIQATTLGANHDVDAPCESGAAPDVFYEFDVSKRVFVYADTFGASWNTVLYLLSDDCTPLAAPTTTGDAVCSGSACGTSQSQIVALLEAGKYRLGLTGHAGAAGAATIHFQFALAGSGSAAPLPPGSSTQAGTTLGGGGNIQGISTQCLAAGPENSYWWTSCPSDPGGAFSASTCGGATWETVLALELPASTPYTCSLDSCSLQASLSSTIPAGAGLRVLAVDGQGGTDKGSYSMTVSRP